MNPPSPGLGSTVVDEILHLQEVFGLRLVLWVGVVVLGTAVTRSLLAIGARLAWQIGLDSERRLGRMVDVLRLAVWIGGALLALRPLFERVPVLTAGVGALSAALIAVSMPRLVQSLAVGLSVVLRGRYREGDQIEVDGHRGSIRRMGLARTQLRVDDGSLMWLPNAVLDAGAVKVARATGAAPVVVQFSVDAARRERVLERIMRAATLSPFRRAGSRVRLAAIDGDDTRYTVELQTWATRELDMVRGAVHRIVDDALAGATGEDSR